MSEQFLNTQDKIQAAKGKEVRWETTSARPQHVGELREVRGKNLLVFEDGEASWLWLPNIYNLRLSPAPVVGVDHCHASRDGDCYWCQCPQNQPGQRQSHCKLDTGRDDE